MLRRFISPLVQRSYSSLVFSQYGNPLEVLSLKDNFTISPTKLRPHDVHLKILGAAVNPADLNTIEGTYPLSSPDPDWKRPAIAGHEGVGQVLDIGDKVSGIKTGDWLVPLVSHQGTWTEGGAFDSRYWYPIPNNLSVDSAAALSINPATALCMLRDFVELSPGDVVIQNAATSAVGQAIIQLARLQRISTFNIIRDRPEFSKTKDYLHTLGADFVEKEENAAEAFKASGLARGSLGLNCVGGEEVIQVAKLLKKGGALVTYGGMSKKPLSIPTSFLIFKDLTFKGFWWSGHTTERLGLDKKAMIIAEIAQLVQKGDLKIKTERFRLRDYKEALTRQNQSFKESKIILIP